MLVSFSIPNRLKALRKASGLTQEDFAERAGISYKFYQHIESGRKRFLRIDTVERICIAYQISLAEFFKAKHPQPSQRTGANKKAGWPKIDCSKYERI